MLGGLPGPGRNPGFDTPYGHAGALYATARHEHSDCDRRTDLGRLREVEGGRGSGPEIPTGGLIARDAPRAVNGLDIVAYESPFPDNRYKAGVRRFPQLVPVEPGMEGAQLGRRAREFCGEPMKIENAGHFVQECGAPVAKRALEYFGIA